MEVKLFGAAKEVTGSCYGLFIEDKFILVDCGMFQGSKDLVRMNYEDFLFDARKVDALLLTHAHLDHCGRIPKLVKAGFRGKIYATDATRELAEVIMNDAAKIALQDTEHENKRRAEDHLPPRSPIFSAADVKKAMSLFVDVTYGKDIKVTKNVSCRYYDAGHILGAASIQVNVAEGKRNYTLAFSGDLGQNNSVLMKKIEPIKKADYVFVESTYGDRVHPPFAERKNELLRIVNETYNRGGKLLIPSFTVERAQEILYLLGGFMQEGIIPKMKVYIDSPMALKATEVFTKHEEFYNAEVKKQLTKRKDVFDFEGLVHIQSVMQSKKINDLKEPCIIIAGNGMCSAGRIKHHIRNNIENPKTTLLFVGYQAKGSLGYWIKSGQKIIRLLGVQLNVNAKIESIDGFSAHADYPVLLGWLKNFSPKPKKVFICHGEEEQAKAFLNRVEDAGMVSYIPAFNEVLKI